MAHASEQSCIPHLFFRISGIPPTRFWHPKIVKLVALFGPQHGARGEKQDNMVESEFYRDPGYRTSRAQPVWRNPASHGGNAGRTSMCFFSIFRMWEHASIPLSIPWPIAWKRVRAIGKRMIVLDRPNPVNGRQVEGNLLNTGIPVVRRSLSDSDASWND